MSNKTLHKDVERGRKLSAPNHVDAKCSGGNRSTRSQAPLARKCCACQAPDSCKTEQKNPQKSSGDANKVTTNGTSDTPRIRSAQVLQNGCGNESEATAPVSANTSPAGRQRGTDVAKEKAIGEEKLEQASQQTASIRSPAKHPKQTEAKVAILPKILRKESEYKAFDGCKVSTIDSESDGLAGSSKQSTKNMYSSPSASKFKKSVVSNQSLRKEPKEKSSIKKEVPRKKAETKASNGKLKLSTDIRSANSWSDWSSDSRNLVHHITWDGFEEDYRVGQNCCLCDEDLAVSPLEDYGRESDFSKLPVVSVLPCGHVFHHHCLEVAEFTVQEGDHPHCVFCESITS